MSTASCDRKSWTIHTSTPLRRGKGGKSFFFVPEGHQLRVLPDDDNPKKVKVECCDSAGDVLRTYDLVCERLGESRLIRGAARFEGTDCDVEMFISAHSGRMYGSIRPKGDGDPADDEDATGVWTSEGEGGAVYGNGG